ncbi:flavodoxin (plasmid) [Photobacterium sp. GJ3]|uniref:flavodoxin n=1 Tax=Photobacterium sp. GJ3 TaxID=2829502 RepID=UPI001B8AC2F9|nr:flavodoxin [Photobacterium sp. GJ3]QUJ70203.1 flavodoxin [Photobacterium sp. GJ3]
MKIGIYYASTSGNTEMVSECLLDTLGEKIAEKFDIEEVGFKDIELQDIIIFGCPTWDYGNLQSEWEEQWDIFERLNLSGKTVALFGVGDQYGYPEWFLDAMGMIHESLVLRGVQPIGQWKNEGYEFEKSRALTADGKHFVGLAIDEESQSVMTQSRVAEWCCDILETYAAAV